MANEQTTVKYPHVKVQLTGHDGNAYAIINRVSQALRRHGVSQADVLRFQTEAGSGTYDNVLQACMKWVEVS